MVTTWTLLQPNRRRAVIAVRGSLESLRDWPPPSSSRRLPELGSQLVGANSLTRPAAFFHCSTLPFSSLPVYSFHHSATGTLSCLVPPVLR